jgi:hypothetical protein
MSKPTIGEMLKVINATKAAVETYDEELIISSRDYADRQRKMEVLDAIRSLIESSDKGPEVDEEFVKRWSEHFGYSDDLGYVNAEPEDLITMLREAGVRVKEGK